MGQQREQVLWTVFDHPADSPYSFVVRAHFLGATGLESEVILVRQTLEEVHVELEKRGMRRRESILPRSAGRTAVESWEMPD